MTGEDKTCQAVLYTGSRFIDSEPAELCGEPTDGDSDFCPGHAEDLELW